MRSQVASTRKAGLAEHRGDWTKNYGLEAEPPYQFLQVLLQPLYLGLATQVFQVDDLPNPYVVKIFHSEKSVRALRFLVLSFDVAENLRSLTN